MTQAPQTSSTVTAYVDDNATGQDLLNRIGFAHSLADLIIDAPNLTSFRVGVYGNWGQGKTSVLRMIETRLNDNGIKTAGIISWVNLTPQEMRDHILMSLVTVVAPEILDKITRKEKDRNFLSVVADLTRAAKDLAGPLKAISQLADIGMEERKAFVAQFREKEFQQALATYLADKKVVLFIDDLDRLRPELLPDLLLNVREILDIPNLYYVLALSPDIVGEGLVSLHRGWTEPMRFLEKVIEYPFFLPPPTEHELREFIRLNIQSLPPTLDHTVLKDLTPWLPRNPRQIKIFLRYLASMSKLLGRFNKSEVSLYTLYLCQLLRTEFPQEARQIASDQAVMKAMNGHLMHEALLRHRQNHDKPSEQDKEERPEEKYAPTSSSAQTRFLQLCTHVREQAINLLNSNYKLEDLLLLIERPPLLTEGETEGWLKIGLEAENTSPADRWKRMTDWLYEKREPTTERATALFRMLLRYREKLFNSANDVTTQEEAESYLPHLLSITDALLFLTGELKLTQKGLISEVGYTEVIQQLNSYHAARYLPEDFSALQQKEVDLVRAAFDEVPSHLQQHLYKLISGSDEARSTRVFRETPLPKTLVTLYDEVKRRIEENCVSDLLTRFQRPDGFAPLYGNLNTMRNEYLVQFSLLFDMRSPFHKEENREVVYSIAATIHQNTGIQNNFVTYFQLLTDMADHRIDRRTFFITNQELLQDKAFVEWLWKVSTSRRLILSIQYQMHKDRDFWIKQASCPESLFPLPDWWSWTTVAGQMEPQLLLPGTMDVTAHSSSGESAEDNAASTTDL